MTFDDLIEDMRVTIEARIERAVAAERERCAKICETSSIYYRGTEPVRLVAGRGEPIGKLYANSIRGIVD